MNNRDMWLVVGGIAAGALGGIVVYKNREKIKPLAAELVAKAMNLKDKAMECAAKTKEHAEDIMAEAKHLNEAKAE